MLVSILGHSFDIPERFAEGHRLTQAEAAALNRHLADMVRNAALRWVRACAEGPGLGAVAHLNLQHRISRYAADYTFPAGPPPKDDLQEMARRIVLERLPGLVGEELARAARHPYYQEAARKRLTDQHRLAGQTLAALGS